MDEVLKFDEGNHVAYIVLNAVVVPEPKFSEAELIWDYIKENEYPRSTARKLILFFNSCADDGRPLSGITKDQFEQMLVNKEADYRSLIKLFGITGDDNLNWNSMACDTVEFARKKLGRLVGRKTREQYFRGNTVSVIDSDHPKLALTFLDNAMYFTSMTSFESGTPVRDVTTSNIIIETAVALVIWYFRGIGIGSCRMFSKEEAVEELYTNEIYEYLKRFPLMRRFVYGKAEYMFPVYSTLKNPDKVFEKIVMEIAEYLGVGMHLEGFHKKETYRDICTAREQQYKDTIRELRQKMKDAVTKADSSRGLKDDVESLKMKVHAFQDRLTRMEEGGELQDMIDSLRSVILELEHKVNMLEDENLRNRTKLRQMEHQVRIRGKKK